MVFMLKLPVEFIDYFYKISVMVIIWEKESNTRCLLRSTVLNLVQTRTGTEGDKNTPKPGHGHNPAMTKQT